MGTTNPVVGGIITVIEELVAAWGTISRIIATINLFIDFLKAVKGGGAAPKFATALASAAIVLLDFVANFLLAKLGSALAKFAGKLRGIAKRLGSKKAAKKGKSKTRARRDRAAGRGRRGAGGRRPARPARRRPPRPRGRGARGRPRRPRQQRPRPLPAAVIISRVLRTLSRPARARKPEAAINEKQQQASRLRSQLQRRVPRGRRLTITLDRSVQGVLQDDDIDFTVALSPGTKGQAAVRVPLEEKSEIKAGINASHSTTAGAVLGAVRRVGTREPRLRSWERVKGLLPNTRGAFKQIWNKPFSGTHAYGRAIGPRVLPDAWKQARDTDKDPSPKTLGRLRKQIETESRFNSAIGVARNGIFTRRPKHGVMRNEVARHIGEGPPEKYDRRKHYGTTPSKKAAAELFARKGVTKRPKNHVIDHDPPLVLRYYDHKEYKLSDAERRARANDIEGLDFQPRAKSDAQGAEMRLESLKRRKKFGL